MSERIIVTGAAGLIGSNIVRGLNARGIEFILIVRIDGQSGTADFGLQRGASLRYGGLLDCSSILSGSGVRGKDDGYEKKLGFATRGAHFRLTNREIQAGAKPVQRS